jgi:uncharacterized protein VirK/YbjX
VSRVQGKSGFYPAIREAMKTLGNLTLPKFIFALLEGIAQASGVHEFAGISASNLATLGDGALLGLLYNTYDGFFQELGATRGIPGFYQSRLPFPEKPLSELDSNHRSRTKAQRKLKAELRERAYRQLAAQRRIP